MPIGRAIYPGKTPFREYCYYAVRFTAASSGTSATVDDAKLATFSRTGTGTFKVALTDRWARVFAVANMKAPAAATDRAFVDSSVEGGTADNEIVVKTEVGGAVADPSSKVIEVVMLLGRA